MCLMSYRFKQAAAFVWEWRTEEPAVQAFLLRPASIPALLPVPAPAAQQPIRPVRPAWRRVFEPRFHAPAWGEMPRPQPHAQPPRRRETACSEAQTDPSDAITKLIECLDKIRVSELQGGDRELDSGVASHSFSMSPPGEEKKREEQDHGTPLEARGCCLESPTVTFGESSVAVDDSESSQAALDTQSSQACWSGGLEEELPIDSSSVHEDCEHRHPATEERFFSLESEQVTDIQSNISVTDSSVPRCDLEKPTQPPPTSSSQPESREAKSSEVVPEAEHPADELGCQILKLPFDCVLAPGAAAGAAAGHVLSSAAPYYYNYLSMQATHERMSVLSPSLDELSSRDEMFSTDMEDVDLFPKHVYTGRRLTEVMGGSPHRNEVWLPDTKRYMCACCGKSLNKGLSRSKTSKIYWDEGGDSEEEEEEEGKFGRSCEQPVRVVVRKHISPRKSYILPARHAPKSWYKRGQYREAPEPAEQDQEGEDGKQQQKEAAEAEEEQDGSKLQCRTCQDRPCRDAGTTADQWAEEVIPRRRHAAPPQRQGESCSSQQPLLL
uniref:Bucky ball n=1 Tax=Oryzias latipes TaxID=8090 RepID=A0A3P9H413_ORYLA